MLATSGPTGKSGEGGTMPPGEQNGSLSKRYETSYGQKKGNPNDLHRDALFAFLIGTSKTIWAEVSIAGNSRIDSADWIEGRDIRGASLSRIIDHEGTKALRRVGIHKAHPVLKHGALICRPSGPLCGRAALGKTGRIACPERSRRGAPADFCVKKGEARRPPHLRDG